MLIPSFCCDRCFCTYAVKRLLSLCYFAINRTVICAGSVLHFRKMVCFVDFSKFVVYFQHVSCVNSGSPCQHAHDIGLIWAIMWHSHGPAAHLLTQYWGVKMLAS